MRLKILPSLHALHLQGALPANMRIVGISRREWGDTELRSYIHTVLPSTNEAFLARFSFLQGEADSLETFRELGHMAAKADLLVYLALAPTLYSAAIANMYAAGFSSRKLLTRIMLEKPFGSCGSEASTLYAQLERVVPSENIYLVDHYLAKEWVRDLDSLPVSINEIAQVHIRFLETTGVELRCNVYDNLGALRDVVQNHLLLTLAHMVAPSSRIEALETLPILTPAQVATHTIRAQYLGYCATLGVLPTPSTETYCKISTTLTLPPWNQVAIVLEAGKRSAENRKDVTLTLLDGRIITIPERPNKTGEYATLILAVLAGDHSLFPSMQEIQAQWRFVDPILEQWALGVPLLQHYEPGSTDFLLTTLT